MHLTKIFCSSTEILYDLPSGKPDPNQKRPTGIDTRDRIKQSVQKNGFTCPYYVFNRIRDRIGKKFDISLKKEREAEILCSLYRKAITQDDIKHTTVTHILKNPLSHDQKLVLLNILNEEEKNDAAAMLFEAMKYVSIKNFKGLEQFLNEKRQMDAIKISENFLKSLNIDYKSIITKEIGKQVTYTLTWDIIEEHYPLDFRSTMFCSFAQLAMAEKYGLKKSSWRPGEIETLIKELQDHGPLAIGGKLGRPFYVDAPFKTGEMLGDSSVYGFKPGAKRQEHLDSHMVLVVGAKKIDSKEYVFIIDPNDECDPKSKDTKRVYKISHKNFCENVTDFHGRPSQYWSSEVGFAHYGNFLALSKKIEKE